MKQHTSHNIICLEAEWEYSEQNPNFGVYTQLFVVKHFWLVYTMMNSLRTCFYRMMCINVFNFYKPQNDTLCA